MKKLLTLVMLLCCLCLTGCQLPENITSALTDNLMSVVSQQAEDSGGQALANQFIYGVLSNDAQVCMDAMADGVSQDDLQAVLPKMCAMLPAADSYALTPTHVSANTRNGVTQTTLQFKLEIAEQNFLVQTVQLSSAEGLYNINIAPATADSWDASSPDEAPSAICTLLSLLLTFASIGVTLWAIIHCARHQMKRKWLWLLLVILGGLMLTLQLSDGHLGFRFHIGLYLVASQVIVNSSGFALKLVIPVGPIIYLCRRKALTAQPDPAFAEAFSDSSTPQISEADSAITQEENHEEV